MNAEGLDIPYEPPVPKSYDKDQRDSYDQLLIGIRAPNLENGQ